MSTWLHDNVGVKITPAKTVETPSPPPPSKPINGEKSAEERLAEALQEIEALKRKAGGAKSPPPRTKSGHEEL